jgi:hypothetical protein
MAQLNEIVRETVFWYAGGGFNNKTFKLANEQEQVYAVNIVDTVPRQEAASVVVIARVDGDRVITG